MLTIVLIGASTSRVLKRGDGRTLAFTPRGYAARKPVRMTVYFIGAGPGAPDLITVRGQRLIERCPVCLYAGSLVPAEIVAAAPEGALVRDTAPMHLDEIIAEMAAADARGEDVARVHSGDPSIYGAIAEQMRRLDALGIDYEIVPGVPAFAGAAARHRHRTDAARNQPDHHPHPHLRQGLGHARAREPRSARRERRDARDPSFASATSPMSRVR